MTFKTENWNKSTPKKWRNIGDALLILSSGMCAVISASPFSPEIKLWIITIFGVLAPIGKFITKLFSDD